MHAEARQIMRDIKSFISDLISQEDLSKCIKNYLDEVHQVGYSEEIIEIVRGRRHINIVDLYVLVRLTDHHWIIFLYLTPEEYINNTIDILEYMMAEMEDEEQRLQVFHYRITKAKNIINCERELQKYPISEMYKHYAEIFENMDDYAWGPCTKRMTKVCLDTDRILDKLNVYLVSDQEVYKPTDQELALVVTDSMSTNCCDAKLLSAISKFGSFKILFVLFKDFKSLAENVNHLYEHDKLDFKVSFVFEELLDLKELSKFLEDYPQEFLRFYELITTYEMIDENPDLSVIQDECVRLMICPKAAH